MVGLFDARSERKGQCRTLYWFVEAAIPENDLKELAPAFVIAVITTMVINKIITAYSTAAGPSSSQEASILRTAPFVSKT